MFCIKWCSIKTDFQYRMNTVPSNTGNISQQNSNVNIVVWGYKQLKHAGEANFV